MPYLLKLYKHLMAYIYFTYTYKLSLCIYMYVTHLEKIENKPPRTNSSINSVMLQDTELMCRSLLFCTLL